MLYEVITHLRAGKEGVSSLPLESFYGKCRVFDLVHVEEEIHRQDLEGFQIDPGDIVLLKTRNSALGYVKFLENYVHLKMDAAEYLVNAGVKTLGFDYLSRITSYNVCYTKLLRRSSYRHSCLLYRKISRGP